jgi:prenylcysteine oxidase/farnesylcysteine lyase
MHAQWAVDSMSLSSVSSALYATELVPQIAIIGAGAGGSSAAWKLSQLAPHAQITVYEANDYVGGRSTTVEIEGTPVELGASIFVEVNKHLVSFVRLFNLTLEDPHGRLTAKNESSAGIFDGQNWRWKERDPGSTWSLTKMFFKYGLSPLRATRHVSSVIEKFVKIYDVHPFENTSKLIEGLGLLEETRQTAAKGFSTAGVSKRFQEDVIQAAIRVNYAQDLNIHGVLGCVAFVTNSPAYAVKGGNWQIFEALLKHSNATLQMQTRIKSITRRSDSWELEAQDEKGVARKAFDYILVASPLALSNISISPPVMPPLQPVEYVDLHVTLITTWQRPSSKPFGKQPPVEILTTVSEHDVEMSLLSFSIVSKTKSGEYIYKVFSTEYASEAYLSTLFDEPIAETKIFRHLWQSYPKSNPTESFDRVELQDNLFYANSFERWISTMETASIAGVNAARLMAHKMGLKQLPV